MAIRFANRKTGVIARVNVFTLLKSLLMLAGALGWASNWSNQGMIILFLVLAALEFSWFLGQFFVPALFGIELPVEVTVIEGD